MKFLKVFSLFATILWLSACGGGGGGSSSGGSNNNGGGSGSLPNICDGDANTFFAQEVFPILQTRCMTCHVNGGSAPAGGARWVVHASASDTQTDIDLLIQTEGFQYMLDKPSNAIAHSGGQALPASSNDFEIYAQYIQFRGIENFCDE